MQYFLMQLFLDFTSLHVVYILYTCVNSCSSSFLIESVIHVTAFRDGPASSETSFSDGRRRRVADDDDTILDHNDTVSVTSQDQGKFALLR